MLRPTLVTAPIQRLGKMDSCNAARRPTPLHAAATAHHTHPPERCEATLIPESRAGTTQTNTLAYGAVDHGTATIRPKPSRAPLPL